MTTTTRRPAKPARAPDPVAIDELVKQARKSAEAARRKAAKITAAQLPNRSTAGRNALKVKAQALDEIAEMLTRARR